MRDRSNSRRNDSYNNQAGDRSNIPGSSYPGSSSRRNRGSGTSGYTPGSGGYTPGTGGYTPGNGGYTPGTGGYTPEDVVNSEKKGIKDRFSFLEFDNGNMSVIKIIGLIVLGVIAVMLIVKLVMVVAGGFNPFMKSAKVVVDNIFERLLTAFVGGGIIYFIVMTFLGQYIHPALKSKILPLFILTALLCAFIPVLGSLVGTCVFILIGIGILINLFRF